MYLGCWMDHYFHVNLFNLMPAPLFIVVIFQLVLTWVIILHLNQYFGGLISNFKSIACKWRRRHAQMRGVFTVILALPQRRTQGKSAKHGWMMWLSSHTRLAQWQLYGCSHVALQSFQASSIKLLCTDSSSPEHCSVCTCMLTRRQRLPSTERQLWTWTPPKPTHTP